MNNSIKPLAEIPIPGRSYKVPCFIGIRKTKFYSKFTNQQVKEAFCKETYPILLPLHYDEELGIDVYHFHYDNRFIKRPISHEKIIAVWTFDDWFIKMKWLKNYRQHSPLSTNNKIEASKFIENLSNVCRNKRLGQDMRCPHKKVDLAGCPVLNDRITCPAHGAVWERSTGRFLGVN